jgi:hypothetical protein
MQSARCKKQNVRAIGLMQNVRDNILFFIDRIIFNVFFAV